MARATSRAACIRGSMAGSKRWRAPGPRASGPPCLTDSGGGTPALLMLTIQNQVIDAAQAAVALGVIHAVADDEIGGDIETDIRDCQIQCRRRRLAQQRAQPEAHRLARPQPVKNGRAGAAGIEDVLDDE